MNWHILGGGAIGSLWASRLSRVNTPYIIQRHVSQSSSFWLTLEHPNKTHEHCLINSLAATNINTSIDALLITTKSQQTQQAIQSALPYINDQTIIVLLQNGMGNQQWLQQQFPNNPLYAGVCTDGVWRDNNKNFVTIAGYGATTIGPLNSHANQRLLQSNLPYSIQWQDDIWPTLWEKLAINCAINGLTAIHQCRNGQLLTIPNVEQQMHSILKEVADISKANHCAISLNNILESVHTVIEKTQFNYSSMYQDIAAKRATEIQAINGYICSEGIKHNIATPTNHIIEQAVIQLEHYA